MSKRSRQKRDDAMQRRVEQQAASTTSRPSIGQLVLQRLGALGTVNRVAQAVGNDQQPIKVIGLPDQKGMQTVPIPKKIDEPPCPPDWPTCPPSINKMEWRRALENKEYYELRQMEDGDEAKPWFQYPRHPYQYSEFVYLTKPMAEALMKYNPVNRDIKDPHADAIARDVQNQRWLQTHESLAINTLGNMHDGQHRARGLIESGVDGWPFYFTWNVPPEAIYVTDSGDVRKINERLKLLFPDSKLNHKTAAICRSMMWGLSSRGTRFSETEIAEFAVQYQRVIVWVATHLRGYRADLQAVIAKSLLWWGEDKVKPFVVRLKAVEFKGDGDPAKALYLWLQRVKSEGKKKSYANPLVYYKKTLAAIHAHAADKHTEKIYAKQDDVFEWDKGWAVPKTAPCKGQPFTSQEPTPGEAAADVNQD